MRPFKYSLHTIDYSRIDWRILNRYGLMSPMQRVCLAIMFGLEGTDSHYAHCRYMLT